MASPARDNSSIPRPARAEWEVLAFVVMAAFGLRLLDAWLRPDIPLVEAAPDEEFSLRLARMPLVDLLAESLIDTHPPLYYMALRAWFFLTPDTQLAARAFSALFSSAALIWLFAFTYRIFGHSAAWFAVLFGALSPYMIYWGHLARMHAILPLFILMIVYHSVAYLQEGRPLDRWLVMGAWIIALQLNYMPLVFGITWGLVVLTFGGTTRRRRLELLAAGAAALVSLVLVVPFLINHFDGPLMKKGFFQEIVSPIFLYYHGIFGEMGPYQQPHGGLRFLAGLALFTAVTAAAIRPVGGRWWFWMLLLLAPTLPLVIAWWRYWTLAGRHLLFCQPFFLAYWGVGCAAVCAWLQAQLDRHRGQAATAPPPPLTAPATDPPG